MQALAPRRGDEHLRAGEYQQVVGMVNLLTNVRFKLAAFVPTLTAAAVALISSADVSPLTQVTFGLGGLVFVLGIVVYDLRNSQIYNGAIGRAKELEKTLFLRYGGDSAPGLFGSRQDTDRAHRARGTNHFLRLPVNHGVGMTLVYAASMTAWVWVILDGVADLVLNDSEQLQLGDRVLDANDVEWWVAGATMIVGAGLALARHRHERRIPRAVPAPVVVGVRLSEDERKRLLEFVERRHYAVERVLHDVIEAGLPEDPGKSKREKLGFMYALELNPQERGLLVRRKFRGRLLAPSCERRVRAAVRRFEYPQRYGSSSDHKP